MGTSVSCTLSAPQTSSGAEYKKSARPPKNRAVIYSLEVAAVYTTSLQRNSCYHGMTPQHYITGATAVPETWKRKWDRHWSQLGLS